MSQREHSSPKPTTKPSALPTVPFDLSELRVPLADVGLHVDRDCDLGSNKERILAADLAGVSASEESHYWARSLPAVHGTSVARLKGILDTGAIYSYAKLRELGSAIVANNLLLSTDELDCQIGMDRYVFLSLGRAHPFEQYEVLICFPNRILQESKVLVALREIVHFGALVSREAVATKLALGDSRASIAAQNKAAATEFLANLYNGDSFVTEVFPKFLEKYFSEPRSYQRTLLYPNTKLRVIKESNGIASINGWEGPQVSVLNELRLQGQNPVVIVASTDPIVEKKVLETGLARNQVILMSEIVPLIGLKIRGGNYNNQLDRGIFLNLVLRDLALCSAFNDAGESYPEHMVALQSTDLPRHSTTA